MVLFSFTLSWVAIALGVCKTGEKTRILQPWDLQTDSTYMEICTRMNKTFSKGVYRNPWNFIYFIFSSDSSSKDTKNGHCPSSVGSTMFGEHISLTLAAVWRCFPCPQALAGSHGVPAKFLALEVRGKRPYHNVLIMRR